MKSENCLVHDSLPLTHCRECVYEVLQRAFATAYLRMERALDLNDHEAKVIKEIFEKGQRGE